MRTKIVGLGLVFTVVVGCSADAQRICGQIDGSPRFAVVLTDFQSTSIGLLDSQGETLTECWIDSGSRAANLVATLSGDVVLATEQPADGLAVIDRFGTDVYSQVSLDSPTVLGQVRLQDPDVSGAFSANPHDALMSGPTSVWISRYAGNADPNAPPLARGSDLLEIDLTTYTRTGGRISLEAFITSVTVATDNGAQTKLAYPRPSRMVRVGRTAIVGLARMTLDFDGAGPGAVAVVDLDARSARLLELPLGVANCGRVVPVPGRSDRVAVACGGFSVPFDDEPVVRETSGLFMLDVEGSTVSVALAWRPNADAGRPLAIAEAVAIDERTMGAVDYGAGDVPDGFYLIDLVTGQAQHLFDSAGSFQIGSAAINASGRLVVPDVSVGLRRFVRGGLGFGAIDPVFIDGGGVGLPPRRVYSIE